MFYEKHKSSYLVTLFLQCNRYRVYLLMKKNVKILTHFGDALYKKYIFLIARGVQVDKRVKPPVMPIFEGCMARLVIKYGR